MKLGLLAAFCAVLAPASAFGGSFDKGGINGVGARAMGMGGAVAAQAGDASALWWNPASAALQRDFELGYHYGSVLGGLTTESALSHRGWLPELDLSYGLGYRRSASASAPAFSEDTTLFSVALPFTDDKRLAFGASAKLYGAQLDKSAGGEAHGFGVDMGLLYNVPWVGDKLTLGLSALDFQSSLDWSTGFNDSPAQLLLLGASYRFDKNTLAEFDSELVTDAVRASRSSQGFRTGLERWFGLKKYGIDRLAALRLGYLQSSAVAPAALSGVFSFGLGLAYNGASLDYAYLQNVSLLGDSHRVSLAYLFGPKGPAAPTPTPAPTPRPTASATAAPSPTATPALTPEPSGGEARIVPDSDVFAPGNSSRRQSVNFGVSSGGGAGEAVASYSFTISKPGLALPLRTLKGQALPRTLRWDGKNQQGRVAPDGPYTATLRITTKNGRERVATATVDVDTRRPSLGLEAYPVIFEPGNPSRAVSFSTKTDKLTGIPARWELLIESIEGKRLKLFEGKGAPPEKISWNGSLDAGGLAGNESLFYAGYLLEMESGALAKSPRLALGSEVTAFKEASAIKVTLSTVKFPPNDEGVALENFQGLKDAAEAVKRYGAEYLVQVLGHADSEEAKGAVGALELSFLRAKAVRDYLVDAGALDASRVKAMGFGAERPAGDNSTDEGRAKNRRVEVILFTK